MKVGELWVDYNTAIVKITEIEYCNDMDSVFFIIIKGFTNGIEKLCGMERKQFLKQFKKYEKKHEGF